MASGGRGVPGSAFLAAVVIGSGIAAQRLSSGETGLERPAQRGALAGQGRVGVVGLGGPQRAAQEPGEFEDHRTVLVHHRTAHAGADGGQQELIDQFLLEVLALLRRLRDLGASRERTTARFTAPPVPRPG
jgi:hypothetical protein